MEQVTPWFGLTVGVVLAFAGAWLLGGGEPYGGLAARAAARIGNPSQVNVRGYVLFGLSYGIASLSCTLPIFLAVVGTSLAVSGFLNSLVQFVLYAMGMGLVITALTIGMALFKGAIVGALHQALRYVQPLGALLMILAGSYIVFYWLSLGGLISR
jgi:cytochrome c biogenesis protein CcdA